jgi:endonuclease/exonuclease/phosphatase (EEP) superfamily protein YafD
VRSVAAWTLAALVLAWTLVRLFGLERGWPLVPLMAFTPYVAPAAVVVAVAVAALRRWAAAAVAAACAAVLLVLLAPRGLADTERRAGVPLRVLTANIASGPEAVPDLLAVVRRERVDVLCVQELDPAAERALGAGGIGRLLPEPALRVLPGFEGTGIYARAPLRAVAGPSGTEFALAAAELRPRGTRPVEVVSVHPPAPTDGDAVRRWRHDLRALPRPDGALRVLAGDFNATLDHRELRRLLDAGYADAAEEAGEGLRTTWPADRRLPPAVTIDHVLADRRIAVRSARVLRVRGTDHRAVLAELVLPRG